MASKTALGIGKGPSTDEEMIKAFVEHATAHRELFINRDVKGSNRAHDRLIKVAVKFRKLPDRGEHILRQVIQSKNESVRKWAAYFMLTLDERLAIRTLRDISKTTESASTKISTETTLDEWMSGNLDVDWFLKEQ